MSYRGRGWSQVRTDRSIRPKGLRGRAIGMFYRDRALAKGQRKKKAYVVHLNIPPSVVASLKRNINNILTIATKQNIQISHSEQLNLFKEETPDLSAANSTTCDIVPIKKFKEESDQGGPSTSKDTFEPIKDLVQVKTEPIEDDTLQNKIKEEDQAVPSTSQENNASTSIRPQKTKEPSSDIDTIKIEPTDEDSSNDNQQSFVTPTKKIKQEYDSQPSTSKADDTFLTPINPIKVKTEPLDDYENERQLYLRGSGDYKYGYKDIITGTFDEKLDESIAKGISITKKTPEIDNMNVALNLEYQDLIERGNYKKFLKFRETLPAYKKSQDLLEVLERHQVVVISGETGCGKSTQVPQIILDDAIVNNRGANVKIFVTQPRRIAASSLAMRVAEERGERMGASVGYAVRLEKVEARPRGSITFCTTGILLADLEVNQGLIGYSHIILDEVHERDCHIDLSMCMLKRVLKKRKDLKLILMSATIDAETLTAYFDDCPMLHIEGKAYPVQDVYLEDVLQMTNYELPPVKKPFLPQNATRKRFMKLEHKSNKVLEQEMQYKAQVGPWLNSIRHKLDRRVFETLQDARIEELDINLIFELLRYLCSFADPGAILVFLPGISDITKLIRMLNDSKLFPPWKCAIFPLHSKLASLEQRKIFERPPGEIRKIIIATNIAETSITIDDIVYVVDCGRIKYSGLNVEENVSTLRTEWVSQANLRQRRGRAGRCQPGICYHLVTSYRASLLEERLLPEIQRSNLLEPVLSIKRLRLGKAAEALGEMASPPAVTTVEWAIKHLQQCGALDESETLTALGWHLARLPVHPAAGKLLLLGALFGCLDRAASVAAVWGFKDPFQMVLGKSEEVEATKRELASGEPSDHVAISEAIIQWERCPKSHKKQFAYDNFLSTNTLELLSEMKHQLGDNLKQMGFLASGDIRSQWENRNEKNMSLFKALVAAALYPNVANCKWQGRGSKKRPTRLKPMIPGEAVNIHPSSVMSVVNLRNGGVLEPAAICLGASWLVYWLKQRSSDLYLIEITVVYTLPLLFFGQLSVVVPDEDIEPDKCVVSIGAFNIACEKSTMNLLFRMRTLLDQVLASKIMASSSHGTQHSSFDIAVLNGITALITAEDECIGEYDTGSDTSEC